MYIECVAQHRVNAVHVLFFFYYYRHHQDLHSFPTRRSSDLASIDRRRGLSPEYKAGPPAGDAEGGHFLGLADRKSTRLNSSHVSISYAVFCLKKKINTTPFASTFVERRSPRIPSCTAIASFM